MNKRPKKRSKLGFIFEHYLADIRHFFRHGLKRRFKFFRGYSGYLGKNAGDWLKTREARRKFAKIERKQQAGKLREEAKLGAVGFFSSVGELLASPFRFPRWAWRKCQELRQMSFREACAEVWNGYREFIANGLNRLGYGVYVVRQFPLWLRALTVLTLIAGFAGLVASPFLLEEARQYRSQAMLTEAHALEEEGSLVQAYQKARTAALLQPNNFDAREYILELAEQVRTPEAVWWAERVAQNQDYDAESLTKVIELATFYGRPKIGLQYLGMLKDNFPDDPAITDAEIRILLAQGRRMEALAKASQAYREGYDSKVMHQLLAEQYLSANDPVSREVMADYLRKHLTRDDEVGLMLMGLVLAYYDRLTEETQILVDLDQLWRDAQAHPDADSELRILALGRAYQVGSVTAEEATSFLVEELDPSDAEERQKIIEYAGMFGLYGVIEHMPDSARKEYADMKLEGLLKSGEADAEARVFLDQAKVNGVSPHTEAFARAVLAQRSGDAGQFSEQLIRALDAAELKDWPMLERQAILLLAAPQLLEFYRESLRSHPDNAYIVGRGLGYAYAVGADDEMALWSGELPMTTFRRDPYNQIFLIYLKALHERDLPSIRYYGEQLIAQNPREPIYYVVLAFAYAQSGQPELASSILDAMGMEISYEALPAFLRVCLAKTGQPAAAEGLKPTLAREKALLAPVPGEA